MTSHTEFIGDQQLYPAAYERPHAHDWAQVSLPVLQPLAVLSGDHVILVPPNAALWMPAGVMHLCRGGGDAGVRNVSLRPTHAAAWPRQPCVLQTTPFLRELVCHMSSLDAASCRSAYGAHLAGVLAYALTPGELRPVNLRMPHDRRLRTIAAAVMDDVLDDRSLQDWAAVVGASYRTLARRFVQETALTFTEWRDSVRLVEAARQLAAGKAVCNVAAALGYCSAAGFTAMFKRRLGLTPSDYQRNARASGGPF